MFHKNRRHRISAVFLAISYGLGSLLSAFFEYREALFSQRFGLPMELLYATFAIQFLCSIGVLFKRHARWSVLCLSATTLGAIYAHFRIASPSTSIVALAYLGLQIWFWYSLQSKDTINND